MSFPVELYLVSFVVIALVLLSFKRYIEDVLIWNNGVCKKNGKPWVPVRDYPKHGLMYYRAGTEVCQIHWQFVTR